MAEPPKRKVDEHGLLISFVKYRKPIPPVGQRNGDDHFSLVCLHHYDQVVLYPRISTISQIEQIAGRTYSNAVAAKWLLAFRFEKDASQNFNLLEPWLPVYRIILLRLNARLVSPPTLELESLAAEYVRAVASPSLHWGLFRTFVPRELLLVVGSNTWNDLEDLHRRLERTALQRNKVTVPVFDFVESWPCISPAVWDTYQSDRAGEDIESILAEQVPVYRALRVQGACQKHDGLRYECCRKLDKRILDSAQAAAAPKVPPRDPEVNKGPQGRRPITGVYQDREVDRPVSSVRDLLGDVRLLREQCSQSDACCSVYLARTTLEANEIHHLGVDPKACHSGRSTDLLPDFPFGQGSSIANKIAIGNQESVPPCLNSRLASIRDSPGGEQVALQLESVRDTLVNSLNNTHVAQEFLDLSGYLSLFDDVEESFRQERQHPSADAKNAEYRWAALQAEAQDLAEYLRYATWERNRDDISGLSHRRQSAPLGSSGISRLAAGGFAVEKTLSHFSKASDIPAFRTPRLCVIGQSSDYRELGRLPIMNSVSRSLLEPYFYFGLGLEAGRIFWRHKTYSWALNQKLPVLANPLKLGMPDRKIMAEYLADAFCLNRVFCGNTENYLVAWVPHFLGILEREYQRVVYDSGGSLDQEFVDNHLKAVAGRLIIVATVGYVQSNFPINEACKKAVSSVRLHVSNEIQRSGERTTGVVGHKLRDIVDDFQTVAQSTSAPVIDSFQAIAQKILDTLRDARLDVAPAPNECVDSWNRGEIVDESSEHPLAALALIRPNPVTQDTSNLTTTEWARNIAAVVSVGLWQERQEC
jgi:hypothetical protein